MKMSKVAAGIMRKKKLTRMKVSFEKILIFGILIVILRFFVIFADFPTHTHNETKMQGKAT